MKQLGYPARRHAQRGFMVVLLAFATVTVLGITGMALDLGHVYKRRTDLQNLADATALAAARELNGTVAGIASALARAQAIAAGASYRPAPWSGDALRFGSDPDDPSTFVDAATAQGAPEEQRARLLYAMVDTAALPAAYGQIDTVFMRAISAGLASVTAAARAVAGRAGLQAVPLAVCAMDNSRYTVYAHGGATPSSELREYGFRRGVGYNLLALNPNGSEAVSYLIDPFTTASGASNPAHFDTAAVAPFVCSGSMPLRSLSAEQVHVSAPFPAALAAQLNSRFDQYADSGCNATSAPPDRNVRQYGGTQPYWWMTTAPDAPAARAAATPTSATPLRTIADLPSLAGEPAVPAGGYGPLWSYARAVRYAAAPPFANYATANWSAIYKVTSGSAPAANAFYPSSGNPPYIAGTNQQSQAPSRPGASNRRVLNVALLACPVAPGSAATVLGIGKFLMTVPATASAVYGEFGGLASEPALTASVELFR